MSTEMRRALNELYAEAQEAMGDYGSTDVEVLKQALYDLIAKVHLVQSYDTE